MERVYVLIDVRYHPMHGLQVSANVYSSWEKAEKKIISSYKKDEEDWECNHYVWRDPESYNYMEITLKKVI